MVPVQLAAVVTHSPDIKLCQNKSVLTESNDIIHGYR